MLVEKTETASTNDDARALAAAGAPHGTAVLAKRQTQGRGRAGRSFASPAGGLYLSILLRPTAPPHHWPLLPLLSGAATASALRETGFPVEIKWPNDLIVCGRKLGGILVESRLGADPFAITGIGLNLHAPPPDVPGTTALAEHGAPPQARALAEAIRTAILTRAARLDQQGPNGILAEVRALCATLGRRVETEKGEGIATDIAEDGALVVDMDGTPVRILAGDVRLRIR